MLGNKGAVAVSLQYGETVFGFVNCHLAAHQDMTAKRNEDYKEIVANLQLGTQGMGTFRLLVYSCTRRTNIPNAWQGVP